MKNIHEYILLLDNVIPNALCENILNEYKDNTNWLQAATGSGVNSHIRNCKTVGVSFSEVISKNEENRKNIDKDLFTCAAKAIQEYNNKFTYCAIEQDSGYELLKYEVGSFYTTHTDSFKNRPRAVSCSFALNDDYEGGEFAFFDRELKYKLKKGSCIMFPSNFMYPHEIMPVTSGTRYSIVTWFV
jgi:predicted 2-oxoglutarate/Fe(II)-dependent dioxygenase YbiX